MTDIEFDIIDELYFITGYTDLKEATGFSHEQLKPILINLVIKGWIKAYKSMDEEFKSNQLDLEKNIESCLYLASKKGLLEHNAK